MMVDFPLPEAPTMATNSPGRMSRLVSSSTSGPSAPYRKETCRKVTWPFRSPGWALRRPVSVSASRIGRKAPIIGTIAAASISRTANGAGESALGGLIADSQLAATTDRGAVIALMNPGGIRADLNASGGGTTVTFGDSYAVQPFGNTLVVLDLTGAQIKALLEQQFDNPSAGQNRILQVSRNFTYSYDSTAPAGSRVDPASIKLGGAALDPNKAYRVTVNSFLATGGDGFTTLRSATNVLQLPNLGDVDALNAYVTANPGVAGGAQDRIVKLR